MQLLRRCKCWGNFNQCILHRQYLIAKICKKLQTINAVKFKALNQWPDVRPETLLKNLRGRRENPRSRNGPAYVQIINFIIYDILFFNFFFLNKFIKFIFEIILYYLIRGIAEKMLA